MAARQHILLCTGAKWAVRNLHVKTQRKQGIVVGDVGGWGMVVTEFERVVRLGEKWGKCLEGWIQVQLQY